MQHTEGMSLLPSSLEMSGVDVALEQMHYFKNHPFQMRNDEKMTETVESVKRLERYIRLAYLLPELLTKVDDGTLSFSAAVDVSHLTESEQEMLLMVMERDECVRRLASKSNGSRSTVSKDACCLTCWMPL